MPSQLGADQFVHEIYNSLSQILCSGRPEFQACIDTLKSWLPESVDPPGQPAASSASTGVSTARPPFLFFVDVGAADGIELSNTEALERLGWRGVAIDPLLRGFEGATGGPPSATAPGGGGRRCVAVRAAVYSTAGQKLQFVLAQDPNLSGFADHIQAYRSLIASQQHQVYEVETRLLEDILVEVSAPRVLHYLSLDTEGSEFEILRSFPWASRRLGALTVEHNFEEPKRSQIRQLMREKGLVLAKEVAWDDWFVDAGLWELLKSAGAPVVQWQPSQNAIAQHAAK